MRIYTDKDIKILKEQLQKVEKENIKNKELMNKQQKIYEKQLQQKDEIIADLDNKNYKEQFLKVSKNFSKIETKYDVKIEEIKKLKTNLKTTEKENEMLKKKVMNLEKQLGIKDIQRKKDSSNSSKPSSTNGYKNVVTNRREKSTKPKGGQKGHIGAFLSDEKIEEIKKQKDTIVNIVKVNEEENINGKYKIRRVVDTKVVTIVTEYWYYEVDGKYKIPNSQQKNVNQYGNNIKALTCELMMHTHNSTDAVKMFINSITKGIQLSKATLINWQTLLSKKLEPQIKYTEKQLLKSYFLNCDESQIKIDGKR